MDNKTNGMSSIKNPFKLVVLFLLPGALVVIAYALLLPPVINNDLPNVLALGIAATVVLIPVLFGIILFYSKKENGAYSIRKALPYTKPIAFKNYLWLVPLLLAWSIVVFVVGKNLDVVLKSSLFSWIPESFMLASSYQEFDKTQLLVCFLVALFITGIIVPIVEEIYFRGFLLPRTEWMGKWAPILNACLFSIYHFWSPWQIPTRIIALIPLCFVAYKTKNIKITIIVHCLLNIMGDAVGVLALLLQ